MNPYAIPPLLAFFANIVLAGFVFYRDPKGKLNILYVLVAFAVAIWSLGDFLVFSSPAPESALRWDKLSTFGAILTPALLLNFVLIFTRREFAKKKLYLIYAPPILLEFVNLTTDFIQASAETSYWGYRILGGVLYGPFIFYMVAYVFVGVWICYHFYLHTKSEKERVHSRLITIAVSIPLAGGILTDVFPRIIGFELMPLTTTLSTFTVVVIAYTIIRHKLMTPPISFTIFRKIMFSFFIIALLMCILGYSGIYALQQFDMSTKKILEEQQPILTRISHMKSGLLTIRLKLDEYIATKNKAHLQAINKIVDHIENDLFASFETMNFGEEEMKVLEELRNGFDSYKNLIESLISYYERNPEEREAVMTKKVRIDSLLENALLVKLDVLYGIEEKKAVRLGEASHAVYLQSFWIIVCASVILIVAGGISSFLISRSIANPLVKMAKIVSEIARGKFERRIDIRSNDEVGQLAQAFNQMARDLKGYQEQVKKHAEELEKKVRERTRELNAKVKELTDMKTAMLNMMEDMDETNKELVRTQEKLKKLLQELREMDVKKDQFISIAAHELKTPLTSIHGFSQLLQNREIANDPAKREKYLKIMDHETKRLAKLVNDILDLSRIDLGTVKLAFEKVNVNELIENVRKEMDVQIKDKGLQSEYVVEEKLPKIITDREKLTEILMNLINNAVKYTPKGKITVKVFRENEYVHFVVKDTGIGIPKDKQDKIFERFYQIDSSFTRKAGGTGLGLALCKEFVNLLGGRIWVKSETGKGSEFHFVLPIKGVGERKVVEMEEKAKKALKKSKELKEKLKEFGWEVKL